MRFSALCSLVLLAITGCSAASTDEAGAQSADVTTGLWTEREDQSVLGFTIYGSGDVPAGSACAPGAATYTLNTKTRTLSGTECTGSPLRPHYRSIPTTEAQVAAIVSAARAVQLSDRTTCDTWGAPYVVMTTFPAWESGATFTGAFVTSDRFSCDAGWFRKYASGIENVVALIEPIAKATPAPPAPVFVGALPTPATVWSKRSTTLNLEAAGSGETPKGSTCINGATSYLLNVSESLLSVTTCEPMADAPGARLALVGKTFHLTAAEMSKLDLAMVRLWVTLGPNCTPGAEYMRATILATDETGAPANFTYTSSKNACALGSDYAPYLDLSPARATLDEIVAAHP